MTRTRYRRRFSPVRVSDWTATAYCPDCERQIARFRISPERAGFYMVTKEQGSDPSDHIAIVRTFNLAKATAVCAAEYAAIVCPSCFHGLVEGRAAQPRRGLSPFKQVGRDHG